MMFFRNALRAFFVTLIAALPMCSEAAVWQPKHIVEIEVGVTPGGPVDISARLIQQIARDRKLVAAPMIVMNRPGANNAVAWLYLNQHAGDAHYIAMTLPNIVTNRLTGAHPLSYRDVTPLAQLNSEYIAFSVRADSPIKTGRELIERLRQNPGSVTIAFSNIGSANHVGAGVLFKAAGLDVRKAQLIPYKGAADAVSALLGGHVDAIASSASTVHSQVQAGSVRTLAVASPKRLAGTMATAPTWKELGVNAVFSNWRGVIGPKGLTAAQVAYWDSVIGSIVKTDEWLREVERRGWEADYLNSAESRKFLDRQNDELKSLISDLGLSQ